MPPMKNILSTVKIRRIDPYLKIKDDLVNLPFGLYAQHSGSNKASQSPKRSFQSRNMRAYLIPFDHQ